MAPSMVGCLVLLLVPLVADGARVRQVEFDTLEGAQDAHDEGSWNRCRSGIFFQLEDHKDSDLDVATRMISAGLADKGNQDYESSKSGIILQTYWSKLGINPSSGKWTFIAAEQGFDSGYSSHNLAECVAGCPGEWLRWGTYNTTWTTYATDNLSLPGAPSNNDARQFNLQAGCNTPLRQAAHATVTGVGAVVHDLEAAPAAWKEHIEEQKKIEAYQWGDAPQNACKGGITLIQSNGTTADTLNTEYVDKGRLGSVDGVFHPEHQFRSEALSETGFLTDKATYLRFSNQWQIVVEVGGISHFNSGFDESYVATCLTGCPTAPDKSGEQIAWLDQSYMTLWQVGSETVLVQAKCRHVWFGH